MVDLLLALSSPSLPLQLLLNGLILVVCLRDVLGLGLALGRDLAEPTGVQVWAVEKSCSSGLAWADWSRGRGRAYRGGVALREFDGGGGAEEAQESNRK